jgi:hypothetical protein
MAKLPSGRLKILRLIVPASLLVACSSECVYYPCPLAEAAEISVTTSPATASITGLALALSGAVGGTAPCQPGSGAASVCRVFGGPGTYQAELTAPGYQTAVVKFTVTGTTAGCNTCGHVDRRMLSVVMQPAIASLHDVDRPLRLATFNEH